MYTEKDLEDAQELRDRIHARALEIVRLTYPDADRVYDRHSVEEYLTKYWDYPGAWYTMTAIPEGYRSRDEFIDSLVKRTLERIKSEKQSG